MMTIRDITAGDAAAFLDLCLALDHETAYMMYEPGERGLAPVSWTDRH